MAEYQINSNKTLSFELKQGDQLTGKLVYDSWFRFDASVEVPGKGNYLVQPKGFWGTTIELKDGEKILLQFKMNWKGEILIQTHFNDREDAYIFKHKGLFKESYILTNQEGAELLLMKPDIKWAKMVYEFQATTSEEFEALPDKELLLIISLHCANYYLSMMTGGM